MPENGEFEDIIEPKDFTPPLGAGYWLEPAACRGLDENGAALILLEAPSGSGKTAFLSQLYKRALDHGERAAWVSLNGRAPSDRKLLKMIILSFARGPLGASSASLALALSDPQVPVSVLLAVLMAEVESQASQCTLYLDGIAFMETQTSSPSSVALLQSLIGNVSHKFRLRISCRHRVNLNISQLAVHDQVRRLGLAELALSSDQMKDLMQHGLLGSPPPEFAEEVFAKVRGWPVGLFLALQAARIPGQGKSSGSLLKRWRELLSSFFTAEILPAFGSDHLDYLRWAALFGVFTDALVGRVSDGAADAHICATTLLERGALLERVPTFMETEPAPGNVPYRLHQCFQEFLLKHFSLQLSPDELTSTYLEAADELRDCGLYEDAINFMLEAGNHQAAATLLGDHGEELLMTTEADRIRTWCLSLPEQMLSPQAIAVLAWSHIFAHNSAEAKRLADLLEHGGRPSDHDAALGAHIQGLKVALAIADDDLGRAGLLAEAWRTKFQGQATLWLRRHMSNALSFVSIHNGRFTTARTGMPSARLWDAQQPPDLPLVYHHCYVARTYLWAGNFDRARQQLNLAEGAASCLQDTFGSARYIPITLHGLLQWEQGEFGKIESQIEDPLPDILRGSTQQACYDAITAVARMCTARGEFSKALDVLDYMPSQSGDGPSARRKLELEREKLRVLFFQNQVGAAETVLAQMRDVASAASAIPFWKEYVRRVMLSSEGLIAYTRADYGCAVENLTELLSVTANSGLHYQAAQIRGLLTASLWKLGHRDEALAELHRLLRFGQSVRLRQTVLDWRATLEQPLRFYQQDQSWRRIANDGEDISDQVVLDYVAELLVPGEPTFNAGTAKEHVSDDPGLLSERENDILRLAGSGYSTKQIARQLTISPNTVKWHLKNVYRKTGVGSRAAAYRFYKSL